MGRKKELTPRKYRENLPPYPLTFGENCPLEDREIITRCYEALGCRSIVMFAKVLGVSPVSIQNWKKNGFKFDKFRDIFKSTYIKKSSN